MADTTAPVTSSCKPKTSVRSRSNLSAQMCAPVTASINCPVIRTFPEALRTDPSRTYRTPSLRPTSLTSTALPLNVKLELRAITNNHLKRESAVMISSTIPSAKYSCLGSSLMFSNGRTAMEALSGSGGLGSMRGSCLSRFTRRTHLLSPDWLFDVLHLLNTKVNEGHRQYLAYLIVCRAGDTHASPSCHSSGWKSRQQRSPDTVVVISSDGEGDRSVESLEVKAPVGWETS